MLFIVRLTEPQRLRVRTQHPLVQPSLNIKTRKKHNQVGHLYVTGYALLVIITCYGCLLRLISHNVQLLITILRLCHCGVHYDNFNVTLRPRYCTSVACNISITTSRPTIILDNIFFLQIVVRIGANGTVLVQTISRWKRVCFITTRYGVEGLRRYYFCV